MNKFLQVLPFALLLVLVPFFYYTSPNIAQSIIIIAISALCGYQYYLMSNEQPDYSKRFQGELNILAKEMKSMKESYGKLTINEINKKDKLDNQFRF